MTDQTTAVTCAGFPLETPRRVVVIPPEKRHRVNPNAPTIQTIVEERYTLTPADIIVLQRLIPGCDVNDPPWKSIRAKLIANDKATNENVETLDAETVFEVLRVIERDAVELEDWLGRDSQTYPRPTPWEPQIVGWNLKQGPAPDDKRRFPNMPITNLGELQEWLKLWLHRIDLKPCTFADVIRLKGTPRKTPEEYQCKTEDIDRELRNGASALLAWNYHGFPTWTTPATSFNEAKVRLMQFMSFLASLQPGETQTQLSTEVKSLAAQKVEGLTNGADAPSWMGPDPGLSPDGLENVIHAAEVCLVCATALLDYSTRTSLTEATLTVACNAAEGLYEANHTLFRYLRWSSSPYEQLFRLVADSTDRNADYGVEIVAAHCHRIAWVFGQEVLTALNQSHVVGQTLEGKVVTCKSPFRNKWEQICDALHTVARIEYPKFLVALQCEATRARARIAAQVVPTPSTAPISELKLEDDHTGRASLVPSIGEFRQLREFLHGLNGDEFVVFELLLARLDDAAKNDGLPRHASEADIKAVIPIDWNWTKFNTCAQWQGLQTRLNQKLKNIPLDWRVSSKKGAHLRRVKPTPKRKPKSRGKVTAKRARSSR